MEIIVPIVAIDVLLLIGGYFAYVSYKNGIPWPQHRELPEDENIVEGEIVG